jgi:hypothetical protein
MQVEDSPWSPPKCGSWRSALGFGARNQGPDFEERRAGGGRFEPREPGRRRAADILERAQRAASFVEEIASAAAEQANGLKEINTGVNQLDHVTQQNRAVSEETTASAADLLTQSDELIAALSEFRIDGTARMSKASGHGATAAERDSGGSEVAVKPKVADWQAAADAAARVPRAQPAGPAKKADPPAAPAAMARIRCIHGFGGASRQERSWHEF